MRTPNTSGLDQYLNRVGVAPLHRLKWTLGIVNRFRESHGGNWSPGDWDNARLELAVFAGIGITMPGWGGIPLVEGSISEQPSLDEAKAALTHMQRMVENAEARKSIRLGLSLPLELMWNPKRERYSVETHDQRATWPDRIAYSLFYLLLDEGYRIRRCPSKLPYQGTPCHTYFLKAKRAIYCSIACASREMTRAKRARDESSNRPPSKRGRPRKNPGQQVSQDHKTVKKEIAKKGAKHGTKRRTR